MRRVPFRKTRKPETASIVSFPLSNRRFALSRLSFLLLALAPAGFAQRITLQEACNLALRNNPHIAVDSLMPLIADESTSAARSLRFPTILGHSNAVAALDDSRLAAAGAINNPIIFSRVSFGASVNQIVTDFGRTSNLVQSAKLRADSQRQSLQASRAQVLLAVHRAYFAALRSRKNRDAAEQSQARLRDPSEIAQAEANFAVVAARNEYAMAMTELAALLGAPAQTYEIVEPDLAAEAPPSVAVLIGEALRNRPEIAALKLERDAAARFAKAEAKLALPVVSAVGFAGGAPAHSARLNPRYAAAGVLVNFPVFNGHLFDARRNDAQLRLQSVEQRLKELENNVSREAAIAALTADTAYRRVLLLEATVRLSTVPAEKERAETRLVQARYDYQMLRAAIDFQLGRLR
jgi:outer membrane protein